MTAAIIVTCGCGACMLFIPLSACPQYLTLLEYLRSRCGCEVLHYVSPITFAEADQMLCIPLKSPPTSKVILVVLGVFLRVVFLCLLSVRARHFNKSFITAGSFCLSSRSPSSDPVASTYSCHPAIAKQLPANSLQPYCRLCSFQRYSRGCLLC